jgi:MoaA/NifB/PqqE/SkfB family radical SAM enzyme
MTAVPPSIDWWITSRCNLKCDYCYGPRPKHDHDSPRAAIAQRIARSLAPTVTFCGGEPLLVEDLDAWAREMQAAGKRTVLNTNGLLLRRRLAGKAPLPFDVIGISIDGPSSEIHRVMRGRLADVDEAVAAAIVARERGHVLKIGTMISGVNAPHVEQLAALIKRIEPAVWRLYQYSPWGEQNTGQRRHAIDDDMFVEVVNRATEAADPIQVHASPTALTKGCLIVAPDGDILTPTEHGYIPIGNCLHNDIDTVWQHAEIREAVLLNKSWHQALHQGAQ